MATYTINRPLVTGLSFEIKADSEKEALEVFAVRAKYALMDKKVLSQLCIEKIGDDVIMGVDDSEDMERDYLDYLEYMDNDTLPQ